MSELPPGPSATRRAMVFDFLQANAKELGPWDPDSETPWKDALLSEYVLVANWIDPEDGEASLVFSSSENLLRAHRIGLLKVALEEWD